MVLLPKKKTEESERSSLNGTFTSEFLGGGSGVSKKVITRERAQTREGIPPRHSGFRRTLKPSLMGKNFTIAGHMFRLKERPSGGPTTKESPQKRREERLRSRQEILTSSMVGGRVRNGSIEVPQTSQGNTFLESDVISPVTVSKGLRESQEDHHHGVHFPDTEDASMVLREEVRIE